MNKAPENLRQLNWEQFGYKTALECREDKDAVEICTHKIHALQTDIEAEVSDVRRTMEDPRQHGDSLHQELYDRPVPVNDALMLTHKSRVKTIFSLALITGGAGLAGNLVVFWLLGWGIVWPAILAVAMTFVPAALGHLFYEQVVSGSKGLRVLVVGVILVLAFAGYYEFGQSRRVVMDRAANSSANTSYVDDSAEPTEPAEKPQSDEGTFHSTFGGALFLLSAASELALGYFVGVLVKLKTDPDFAAWQQLHAIQEFLRVCEMKISHLFSSIEIAKKQCTVGILRALSQRKKKKIPYYKGLLTVVLVGFLWIPSLRSQTVIHAEGEILDSSGSIGRNGGLWDQYVRSAKLLLRTEPPETRVWVSTIRNDSFGVRDLVRGWTPAVNGVFGGDLARARYQLAANLETKSAEVSANSSGSDIFGSLWHMKVLFESSRDQTTDHTIWIFSDMLNETPGFPMPQLLDLGSDRLFERAKTSGLVVPLSRYKVHVYGASTAGLAPQSWTTIKRFWELYFAAAGAELVTYSAECDVHR